MHPFDAATTPLERGVTLIEASAGTGKTYSIAAIFLRLILEEHLPLPSILAVTYTVAATQELKERIRQRLRHALEALRRNDPGEDEVLRAFLATADDLPRARRELELALASFDEAQIFTIHSFCQRTLQEYAFESGMRERAETLQDPAPLFEEIAADFWRREFYSIAPLPAAVALRGKFSPERWSHLLKQTEGHHDLQIIPPPEEPPLSPAMLEEAWGALFAQWQNGRDAVTSLLQSDKGLSRRAGKLALAALPGHFARLDAAEPTPETLEVIALLATSSLAEQLKKGASVPIHPFFEACEAFDTFVQHYLYQWDHTFLAFAHAELASRKLARNQLSFDDLLTSLHRALHGPHGAALRHSLSERYHAALLDEFQDTDPLQAAIFRALFSEGEHRLFLIGDPKQAIYGFRGADLFAYLTASRLSERRYNLAVNWRSDAPLLAGFNAFFGVSERPFLIDGIDYHPVSPSPAAEAAPPEGPPPLAFRSLEGEPLNKTAAIALTARAVAQEIATLTRAGEIELEEVAILVRNNAQAHATQQALAALGIPSVLQSQRSVFHTAEAEAFARFLEAVAHHRYEKRLRAALATPLFGFDATQLARLEEDEPQREAWLETFARWHERWESEGCMAMFRNVLAEKGVRERLVAHPQGERRITNLLHLAELAHQEESARNLAPDALCHWLCEARQPGHAAPEAAQLRLESDARALTIVTIHRSKGLEYPLVWCPYLWIPDDSPLHQEILFHDEAGRLTFDLRGRKSAPEEHVAAHQRERLAEEARLLYVALTRAKRRCTLYLAPYLECENAALAHFLRGPGMPEDAALPQRAEALAALCPEISFTPLPAAGMAAPVPLAPLEAPPLLAPRTFGGTLQRLARFTSFTALTLGTHGEKTEVEEIEPREIERLDLATEPPPAPIEPSGIHAFEKGTRAGDFFHDLLEKLDFQHPETLETLLPETLALHGLAPGPAMEAAVRTTLEEALTVELAPGLRLADLPAQERLAEVDFTVRLPRLTPTRLATLLSRHHLATLPDLGRLRFAPVEGFLRGSIDLLFRHEGRYYLLDWKSNWLGPDATAYTPAALLAAMQHHFYGLQAHLYLLAADRYLALRQPGYDYARDFGGIFYLFLRGVDRRDPARAIYRDCPSPEVVASLRELLS